jgi:hypothetical protein
MYGKQLVKNHQILQRRRALVHWQLSEVGESE